MNTANGADGAARAEGAGTVEYVPLDGIRPGSSPRRSGEDEAHVRVLAECGDRLPPILVHRESRRVVDGMHRLRAARLRGDAEIAVVYVDGSEDEIFLRAVEENTTHGLPLQLSDRKAAAVRILTVRPEWSDRSIARIAGLSPKTVGAMRRRAAEGGPQLLRRIGQDGRSRPLCQDEARRAAAELIARHPETSLREVARLSGVSAGTARRVRQELSGDRPRETRGRSRSQDRDGRTIVQSLANDPSLKFSELGRALLRRLSVNAIEPDEWEVLLAAVPPHCVDPVRELARAYSRSWDQFARGLKAKEERFPDTA